MEALTQNKRLKVMLISIFGILLVPFIAMQFTNEVNWNLTDFIVAGILLLGTGLLIELAIPKIAKNNARRVVILGIAFLLIIIWAELAVGIFGSAIAGN